MTRDLIRVLNQRNYDDRAEKIGDRNRDKVCTALETLDKRTQDIGIVSWALTKLPKVSIP